MSQSKDQQSEIRDADEDQLKEQTEEQNISDSGSGEQDGSEDSGSPSAGNEPMAEDRVAELEARVAALEAENSDLKEQFLRKQAEFENFRKRMQREKEEAAKFSNKELMLDILPVIDDFERAIRSAEESRDFDAFHDGVKLIEKQFTGMLERKWGLRRFDSEGEEFDPQCHEAVAAEPDPDSITQTVLEDFQKGYYLHDKVLRSAMVKVSVPGSSQDNNDQSEQGSEQ